MSLGIVQVNGIPGTMRFTESVSSAGVPFHPVNPPTVSSFLFKVTSAIVDIGDVVNISVVRAGRENPNTTNRPSSCWAITAWANKTLTHSSGDHTCLLTLWPVPAFAAAIGSTAAVTNTCSINQVLLDSSRMSFAVPVVC